MDFSSRQRPHSARLWQFDGTATLGQRHAAVSQPPIAVDVQDFARAWVTRSTSEQQTYVGAYPQLGAQLNAQLLPTQIDRQLQNREQDYRFAAVDVDMLRFAFAPNISDYLRSWLAECDIRICQTLDRLAPCKDFPISLSYVDTCLAGCLQLGGVKSARKFIETTLGWSEHLVNDRLAPKYPRAAKLDPQDYSLIDQLLGAMR